VNKARPETIEFIEAIDEYCDNDTADLIKASAMFYILDGWEEYWPFPQMPKWLHARYWTADLIERVKGSVPSEKAEHEKGAA
jgi:hypothetical protein